MDKERSSEEHGNLRALQIRPTSKTVVKSVVRT